MPAIADDSLAGSPQPLQSTNSLDGFKKVLLTPTIGVEFDPSVKLTDLLKDENSDNLIRDLGILIAERGVAFFREQDLNIEQQRELGTRLGRLTGNPLSSGLHIHPLTESTSELGSEVRVIEKKGQYVDTDDSNLATKEWHSDITFEPIPADYSVLRLPVQPPTGGDTLWASGYEVYDRLSPSFAAYLETLSAYHSGGVFRTIADAWGTKLRDDIRGHPFNHGPELEAVHPVIRVNPVTGWKSVYVNASFTKRILGVTKDESDRILNYLIELVDRNHDLQVRFRWQPNSVAIWDNRSNFHAATRDYTEERVGERIISLGEKPSFNPKGRSRREALGLKPSYGWTGEGQRT
ncbi:putative TfdA family taurine dioxygenase [Clavulina sp. PMI_390]|nr:putative TfdA family taurine dioxygenase [Clavulina sp. PMI_390]